MMRFRKQITGFLAAALLALGACTADQIDQLQQILDDLNINIIINNDNSNTNDNGNSNVNGNDNSNDNANGNSNDNSNANDNSNGNNDDNGNDDDDNNNNS